MCVFQIISGGGKYKGSLTALTEAVMDTIGRHAFSVTGIAGGLDCTSLSMKAR